ncbi:MAG: ribosomal L7Ae/L30e/S12e/Gadd45 family protein [Clostridia bacterium]|nr:ribosomal L7Ae/L30e/S12e/Gadd45 family protein [Clostridia bacterium]
MNRKMQSLLSLCQRAGKMVTGEDTVEINIKNGNGLLVIIAGDASENTKNKFVNKCKYYNVPYFICCTKEELSSCIGKYNRSVYAVTDKNFAEKLNEIIAEDRLELSNI